jgi:DNA repair exonuclease SbcCD ATPase subunit
MHVECLSIQGFRGFLDRRKLELCAGKSPNSLCIYGDNGCGKSSVADAVEFFFKPDGILDRLKKSQTENNAGISATRHALAGQRGVRTEVSFHFNDGRGFARTTNTAGATGAVAQEMQELLDVAPVPLLMRSHEMKKFVADLKGAERYELLARWVGLERLVAIQDALTKIEGKARKWDKPSAAKAAQVQALDKLTERTVRDWNPSGVAVWLNGKLTQAGAAQKIARLEDLGQVEEELRVLQQGDEDRSCIARYTAAHETLSHLTDSDAAMSRATAASAKRLAAVRELDATLKRLTASELRTVWSAAREYLVRSEPDACPVCARDFDEALSREQVLERLTKSLDALAAIEQAESKEQSCLAVLTREIKALEQVLSRLTNDLESVQEPALIGAIEAVARVRGVLDVTNDAVGAESWHAKLNAAAGELTKLAPKAAALCGAEAERLRAKISIPYAELRVAVKQLITIWEGWNRADLEERALLEVTAQLQAVAEAIRTELRAHLKQVLTALQEDVREIYRALRGNDEHIPVVDVLVPDDKKTMRVSVSLFGINGVPPSGYLSDSQLNSLGLALYLAAVRRFNNRFRFLLLDDIMSSYDASHRLALVHVLSQFLNDFQVIITTHDQAFFREIRSVLSADGKWRFVRLKPWLLEAGVRVDDDPSNEHDIDRRLSDGEKPEVLAQLIMGSVEDWLLKICCDRGIAVPMKIRNDRSPQEPTMGTLWSAGQKVFEERHKQHASYPVLLGHSILNWPRHAATAGQLAITLGELQTFWTLFKTFRDDFTSAARSPPP